jgi:hypothetical protein
VTVLSSEAFTADFLDIHSIRNVSVRRKARPDERSRGEHLKDISRYRLESDPAGPPDAAANRRQCIPVLLWRTTVKALLRKVLWKLGYELRRRGPELLQPDTDRPDASTLRDEVLGGPWVENVLQVSNKYYCPPALRFHYTRFGEDTRLKYITDFLDFRDQRILEIGPLEGHHSILLEKMGVRENIAVEARLDNLQKCVRIKEKYHLDRTRFVQGDLERLCSGEETASFSGPFDLVFCLGVLYHLPDPGRGLEWMRSQSGMLFLGTHYRDRLPAPDDVAYSYRGKSYRAREYQEHGVGDPISGMSSISLWLYEDDLLRLIRDVGYSRVSVLGKDIQNGMSHIMLLAEG